MTDAVLIDHERDSTVTPLRAMADLPTPTPMTRMRELLQRECAAMLHHALEEGKDVSAEMAQRLAQALAAPAGPGAGEIAQFTELTNLHTELSALIAPARGLTLVLLEEERLRHPYLYVFGPVRLVRQMLGFAVFALFATALLSTLKAVDMENVAAGWFPLNGFNGFCVLGFLLAVASLGTAFSNLSTINRYIEQANYDPIYEGSYWVRVVLGLISGVVLGEILFDLITKGDVSAGPIRCATERAMLAFLGGFATAPVQRMLSNLSDAVATLLQGRYAGSPPPPRPAPASVNRSQNGESPKLVKEGA